MPSSCYSVSVVVRGRRVRADGCAACSAVSGGSRWNGQTPAGRAPVRVLPDWPAVGNRAVG